MSIANFVNGLCATRLPGRVLIICCMKTQFVIDSDGNKLAVILPIREYEKIVEELEELEDIRLYDEAKKEGDELASHLILQYPHLHPAIHRTRLLRQFVGKWLSTSECFCFDAAFGYAARGEVALHGFHSLFR